RSLVIEEPHVRWESEHGKHPVRGASLAQRVSSHTFFCKCSFVNCWNKAAKNVIRHGEPSGVIVHIGSEKNNAANSFYLCAVGLNPLLHPRPICRLPLN